MSKADLLEVISELPERCLERAISDCLVSLVANSEYLAADQIISDLLIKVKARHRLGLRARVLGVQIACRNKNVGLAIARYQELAQLAGEADVANAKSNALLQLAAVLLPDSPSQFLALWEASLAEDLPFHAQHELAAVGMMLIRCYLKNGAKAQARTICQTMARTLEPDAYGKKLDRLIRTICQTEE